MGFDFKIPEGGFFVWLDISKYGNDEEITIKLWKSGMKVIPGSYLSIESASLSNSSNYIRIALVGNSEDINQATMKLNRLAF